MGAGFRKTVGEVLVNGVIEPNKAFTSQLIDAGSGESFGKRGDVEDIRGQRHLVGNVTIPEVLFENGRTMVGDNNGDSSNPDILRIKRYSCLRWIDRSWAAHAMAT